MRQLFFYSSSAPHNVQLLFPKDQTFSQSVPQKPLLWPAEAQNNDRLYKGYKNQSSQT